MNIWKKRYFDFVEIVAGLLLESHCKDCRKTGNGLLKNLEKFREIDDADGRDSSTKH